MKFILAILLFLSTMTSGYCEIISYTDTKWVPDTLYLDNWEVTFMAPEGCIKQATFVCDEGLSLIIPFRFDPTTNWFEAITIQMLFGCFSYDDILDYNPVDKELWNTCTQDKKGSRCFTVNGKYTRIDNLHYGIAIFYEGLDLSTKEIADRIISSISTIKLDEEPPNANKKRRTLIKKMY